MKLSSGTPSESHGSSRGGADRSHPGPDQRTCIQLCGGDMREAYTNAEKFVEMNLAVSSITSWTCPASIMTSTTSRPKPWASADLESDRMPDIDRRNPLIREHSDLDRLRLRISRNGADAFRPRSHAPSYKLGFPCVCASAPPFPWP